MSNCLSGPIAWLLYPVTAAVMVFILAPLLVTVAISVSDTPYVVFPPRGFTLAWYAKVLQGRGFPGVVLAASVACLPSVATLGAAAYWASPRPSP